MRAVIRWIFYENSSHSHEWRYRPDGTNQHLVRSILAIRDQGGVALSTGEK